MQLVETMSTDSNDRTSKKDSLASLLKSMGGEDCDRPACDDTKSALSAALKRVGNSSGMGGDQKKPSSTRKGKKGTSHDACPPSKDALGASTWSLIHSMAAWFPNEPTEEDRRFMSNFMMALGRFYPCTYCATDFQRNLLLSPPRTETREDLCVWLCEQHNIVNEKLGKPRFDCSIDKLDERWRKSSNPDC